RRRAAHEVPPDQPAGLVEPPPVERVGHLAGGPGQATDREGRLEGHGLDDGAGPAHPPRSPRPPPPPYPPPAPPPPHAGPAAPPPLHRLQGSPAPAHRVPAIGRAAAPQVEPDGQRERPRPPAHARPGAAPGGLAATSRSIPSAVARRTARATSQPPGEA